jgi:15-cis-phytoene synthase
MTPDQYCKEKLNASHSNFAMSFIFLRNKKRKAMNALYAFCREVDDIADECKEYEIGKSKLDWWRVEIQRLFDNNPQHPVTKALLPHIKNYQLNQEYFIEILDGMEMDLNFNRYESFKQLQLYCYRVASVVGIMSAKIFGYKNVQTNKYAHNLGIALQLTNIMRDIGEDARRDRIYVPLDQLKTLNISENEILALTKNEKFIDLINHLSLQAKGFYLEAIRQLPKEDKWAQLPGLIMANIYYILLHEIKQNTPENIVNIKTLLPPSRKFFIALGTIFGVRWIK